MKEVSKMGPARRENLGFRMARIHVWYLLHGRHLMHARHLLHSGPVVLASCVTLFLFAGCATLDGSARTGSMAALVIMENMEDAPGYETPPLLAASSLFDPDDLSDAYHTVLEEVSNDGYNNHHVIDSTFGEFVVTGHETALMCIQEVRAIATLRETKKSVSVRRNR
jgi:hypothetical protein